MKVLSRIFIGVNEKGHTQYLLQDQWDQALEYEVERVDPEAKHFVTSKKGFPDWQDIIRRRAYTLEGNLTEDLEKGASTPAELEPRVYAKLPDGIVGTRTSFTCIDRASRWNYPFKDTVGFLFVLYGEVTEEGSQRLGRPNTRVKTKSGGLKTVPPQLEQPTEGMDPLQPTEIIKISPKSVALVKPHQDLKDLPQKLTQASPEERARLLQGMRERFWHASAADIVRLLQAALVPRHIVVEGAQTPLRC